MSHSFAVKQAPGLAIPARLALALALAVGLTLSLAPAPSAHAATVRYVKPSATGSGDCSSWANACTLQTALGAAVSGDEIWVAEGTHTPGTLRTDTFTLKNGAAVYGGFAGTETARRERDWVAHPTVLSGDIGTPGDNSDNAYHVVTGSGTDASAVLDGFTVSGGNADGSWPAYYGGGMYNDDGSPTLTNVTFSGNSATYGGGMYNDDRSSPTLTNVTFSGNSAASSGGGMYNWVDSSPTLTNVTFSGNSASRGGGMYNVWSNPTLTNCILWGNTASYSGPQIYNSSSTPTVTYSDIQSSYPGTGNIDADPLFVDADGPDDIAGTLDDNLRLHATSPAVDAGDNTAPGLSGITTDLDGTPRFVDVDAVADTGKGTAPIVDMGAYEAG
ncbi:MAG TPA: right-handed parallel beta-helix repeat-containing protein, partial [Phycisphaerae bacterium]|nr:right-handed parallel beta-helix repeat-containing protein [Phycisphaerae bacterium]